jgi:hypothetical protein
MKTIVLIAARVLCGSSRIACALEGADNRGAIEEGRRCAAAVDAYLARTPRVSFPGVHQFTGN